MRGHRLGVRTGLISGCLTTVDRYHYHLLRPRWARSYNWDQEFESGFLQHRVRKPSVPREIRVAPEHIAGPGSKLGLAVRSPVSAFRWYREDRLADRCVRRLPRSGCHGGAPAERQDDEERGKPFVRWAITVAPAASSNSPNEAAPTDRGGIRPALLEPARPVRTIAHHKLRHWRGPNPKGTHHDRQADRQNCCGDRRQCRHWLRYRRAPPCAPIDTARRHRGPPPSTACSSNCAVSRRWSAQPAYHEPFSFRIAAIAFRPRIQHAIWLYLRFTLSYRARRWDQKNGLARVRARRDGEAAEAVSTCPVTGSLSLRGCFRITTHTSSARLVNRSDAHDRQAQ